MCENKKPVFQLLKSAVNSYQGNTDFRQLNNWFHFICFLCLDIGGYAMLIYQDNVFKLLKKHILHICNKVIPLNSHTQILCTKGEEKL